MNHLHDVVVRPFIEPFSGIYTEVIIKLKIIFFYFFFMISDTLVYLFQISDDLSVVDTAIALMYTPKIYWVGLFIIASIDIFFGCVRAIREPEIEWDWKVFERGAYKIMVYFFAVIMSSVATNMLPLIFGLFQYFMVAMLTIREVASAGRNMGITPIITVFFRRAVRKDFLSESQDFWDEVNEKGKKDILEAQRRKNALKEQRGEKGDEGEQGEKGEKGEKGDRGRRGKPG